MLNNLYETGEFIIFLPTFKASLSTVFLLSFSEAVIRSAVKSLSTQASWEESK